MMLRRQEAVRKRTVICYEEKPFGITVKAPDREQIPALRLVNEVDYCRFAVIFARADYAGRLIEK